MADKRPFQQNPILSAIAMGYRNQAYIADQVIPRVTVPGELFKYTMHKKGHFNVHEDHVGRTGRTNRVNFESEQKESSVQDHGLEDGIPQSDINAGAGATANHDPVRVSTTKLTRIVGLNRELRTAGIVFNEATYPAGHKVKLTAGSRWNEAGGDPVNDIFTGLDKPLIRPNIMVVGQDVATVLQRNEKISRAVGGSAGEGAVTGLDAIAALFGLDEIVVGRAWRNTANRGQTESYSRTWSIHAALLYRANTVPEDMDEITFALTAQYGDIVAADYFDRDIGLRGGTVVRVGESVREVVTAADVGYFIEDANAT